MIKCPICETKADESQGYCFVCAWEFEYYFDELEKEAREMYESRFRVYRSIYDKSILSPKIIYKEKIVYRDRIVEKEKIVYRDKIVPQEKIIYRDRVVEKEKKGFFSKLFGGSSMELNVVNSINSNTNITKDIKMIDEFMYFITSETYSKSYTWKEAKECAKKIRIGGFNDWRLPTREEFKKLKKELSFSYYSWTSEEVNSTQAWAWKYDKSSFGQSNWFIKTNRYHIRCFVRKESTILNLSESNILEGNIQKSKKHVIKLQNNISTKMYTWEEGKKYAESLTEDGYRDWRLPTRIELQRLVNDQKIQKIFIEKITTSFWLWTSEEYDSSNVWSLNFKTKGDFWRDKLIKRCVVCVRKVTEE